MIMSDADDDSNSNGEDEDFAVVQAPSLYTRSVFYRSMKRNQKVAKTVQERYLRDDLGFGMIFLADETKRKHSQVDDVLGEPHTIQSVQELLARLQSCKPHALVVCDTNVLLHNLDVLEQATAVMPNIVIPQTALVECRSNRRVIYDRMVEWLRSTSLSPDMKRCAIFFADPHHVATAVADETTKAFSNINDENDARVRQVAAFYGEQLQNHSDIRVIFLTDDAGSRTKASSSTFFQAFSVRKWIQELERYHPELSLADRVAQFGGSMEDSRTSVFEAHVETHALMRGIQSGVYHRGVLRSYRYDEAAQVSIRHQEERVAITIEEPLDRNRAIDGDVVAIKLNPLDQWISCPSNESARVKEPETSGIASETAEPRQNELDNVSDTINVNAESLRPTGKVVGIVRRNFGNYSGSIFSPASEAVASSSNREKIAAEFEKEHSDGTQTCVFFAVDKRIPPVLIRTSQRDRLTGQRIIVALDSWPAHSRYPLGHYVRTLGPVGSKDVETQVLLHEHNIPHEPFPAAVLACLPPEDYRIDTENSPGRTDLRHLPVLSIDPPGCKDIDDALHCMKLPNGNLQAGVHIADVTHYVKPGTAIDLEAANRSTSTYLVDKRLDMLPGLLTTDLCSLKGNVDRYAFSVIWEVTPQAEIVNVEFKKSIIHSIAALTYQQAQSYIDQPDDPNDVQASAVKRLAFLARKFRKRRIDAGALTLASPEVKFVLDSESLNPTDVQAYALLEANAVVEEFMLLANVTVSKKILRHYPTLSVLRRHPTPNRGMFDNLISKAQSRGFTLNIDDSKKLADSLDSAQLEFDPYVNKLLRILSTRCMSPAQYFCSGEFRPSEWHHYGLAAPVYTHFTSPIRRYADVCVHRLLAAAIGVAPLPPHLSSKSYLHDLCANMNRRHRAAQLAGRASVQLHTLIFFQGEGAKVEDAYVLDLGTTASNEPTCSVIVPRYGIEGRVSLGISGDDAKLQRFPEAHKIVYGDDVSIQVFDRIKVKIWVRELEDHQRELVMDLVEPALYVEHKHKRPDDEDEGTKKTKRLKRTTQRQS